MSAPRILGRLLLAALVAGLALLVIEGALSFSGVATLHERLAPIAPIFDVARRAREAPEPALLARDFDIDPDPLVGRVFRPEATLTLHGVTVTTDELGMRKRPGPALGDRPIRVVVLGDSVAFGWGVRDEETLAARLEVLLTAHRSPDARPVECRTVAVPGWNARNAFAFLFDHLDELAPDIVVYQPVSNDVCDAIVTWETSRRAIPVPDLSSEDPWFHVGYDADFLGDLMQRRKSGELKISLRETGPAAIDTSLGRLSRGRFSAMASAIREADVRLAARGARFFLAPHVGGEFLHLLQDALLDAGGRTREIALFDQLEAGDMLDGDPHPNASAVENMALWVASALVADGALEGGVTSAISEPAADVQARRRGQPSDEEVRASARGAREAASALLLPEVSAETGRGCLQVYGGFGAGGAVGARAQFMLRRDGDELRLSLAPLVGREEMYPLGVGVEIDGMRVLRVEITASDGAGNGASEAQAFRVALPAGGHGGALDVKLVPERWATVPDARGGYAVASFRFVDAACPGS